MLHSGAELSKKALIGKSVIAVRKGDIMECAGNLQVCAGQPDGCEAAVHAITDVMTEESTDGLLLVGASNAFNSLTRKVLLVNIRYVCCFTSVS